jgi:integrase
MKLTARAIEAMAGPPIGSTAKSREVADSEVTGLRVICSAGASRRKFFYFYYVIRGRRRKAKLGEFPAIGLQQARHLALEMRAAVDRGVDPLEQRDLIHEMPTFEQFAMDEYLPWAKSHKVSWDMDLSKLRLWMLPDPKLGKRRLCDITTRDVQMYHAQIKASHSAATANRHLALLSKLFRMAVSWQRVERNPCLGITKFRESQTRTDSLSPDDIQKMLKAMEAETNVQAVAALKLLLLTGTRREEALQARWENVDIDNALWFLPKTKNGKTRHVMLNAEAVALLRGHKRVPGIPWVFPGRDPSKPLNNPRKAFTRVLEAAGLPHMRVHGLRHVFASLAVSAGASLYQVQQLLHHASPHTTQRYAHLANDSLRQASASVSSVFTAAKAGSGSEPG